MAVIVSPLTASISTLDFLMTVLVSVFDCSSTFNLGLIDHLASEQVVTEISSYLLEVQRKDLLLLKL